MDDVHRTHTDFISIRINPYNIYAQCIGPSDPSGGCLTQQLAIAAAAQPEPGMMDHFSSNLGIIRFHQLPKQFA